MPHILQFVLAKGIVFKPMLSSPNDLRVRSTLILVDGIAHFRKQQRHWTAVAQSHIACITRIGATTVVNTQQQLKPLAQQLI